MVGFRNTFKISNLFNRMRASFFQFNTRSTFCIDIPKFFLAHRYGLLVKKGSGF